jgi:hypothetical protein
MLQTKVCGNQNTACVNFFFRIVFVFTIIGKSMEKTEKPQNNIYDSAVILVLCRITKASDPHWECAIPPAFEWQKCLAKTPEYIVIRPLRDL